jgi:hypothetical protein
MQWASLQVSTAASSCAASLLRSAVLLFSLLSAAAVANAQQLTLTIPDADRRPRRFLFTFAGTITNSTGTTLQTSDHS